MAVVKGTNGGFVSSAPSGDPNGAGSLHMDNAALAYKDTSPAGATKITEIGWYCNNATQEANFEVGIYTHDSTNDKPDTLLSGASTTNAKGTGTGWKKATGLNITISENTTYWIVVQLDDTTTTTDTDISSDIGERIVKDDNVSSLPEPYTNDAVISNYVPSIYAVYETGTNTNIKINIGDEWKDVNEIKINIGDEWKDVF